MRALLHYLCHNISPDYLSNVGRHLAGCNKMMPVAYTILENTERILATLLGNCYACSQHHICSSCVGFKADHGLTSCAAVSGGLWL